MNLVVQACHPSWLRKDNHKFKATLDNTARYCFKKGATEPSHIQLCGRVLASRAHVKPVLRLQH